MPTRISAANIQPGAITADRLAEGVGGGPKITNVQVTDNSFNILDDTAVGLSGGYLRITGTGFQSGCVAVIGNTPATATSFISSSFLNVQVGAASAGTYILYVVNPDGGVAIRVNAVTYSQIPAWITGSTLPNLIADAQISIQLSAAGDSPVAYRLLAEFTLPPGLSLSSSGLLTGAVTGLENDTLYSFTVIAEDTENQDSPRTFSVTVAVGDPLFKSTVLLLNGDGINTAQNNTFLDSSTNNFTVTKGGNTTQGSFSPFSLSDGEWSNYFDGSGDYLTVSNANVFDITNNQQSFTLEAWIYPVNTNTSGPEGYRFTSILSKGVVYVSFGYTSTGVLRFYTYDGAERYINSSAGVVTQNEWQHVTVVSNAGAITLYRNGVSVATGTLVTPTQTAGTGVSVNPKIGHADTNAAADALRGYISNLRISNTAVYTADFTPSTQPLTLVARTSFLTCQSNQFIDNSIERFPIVASGDTKVSAFSPFQARRLSEKSYGLHIPRQSKLTYSTPMIPASDDWTIEFWFRYAPTSSLYQNLIVQMEGSGSIRFGISVGSIGISYALSFTLFAGNAATALVTADASVWHHYALTRSGNNIRAFLNGESKSEITMNGTVVIGNGEFSVGDSANNNAASISNLKITTGEVLYTSNFTVPTAPLTVGANTKLLTFQDTTIIDNSVNNYQPSAISGTPRMTRENPLGYTISAALPYDTAYNGGSGYFDGTGDYVAVDQGSVALENWYSEDYSIELWVYPTVHSHSGTNNSGLYVGHGVYNTTAIYWSLGTSNTGYLRWYYYNGSANTLTAATNPLSLNAWSHVALVYTHSTGAIKGYVNGVEVLSGTKAGTPQSLNTNDINIGVSQGTYFTGYISNLRIVKGTAVYTSAFAPIAAPLTAVSNTSFLCNFTNAAIIDYTGKNLLETVGTAQISTAEKKYGTGSILLSPGGGSHYTRIPLTDSLKFGTGNFTIECWIYLITNAAGICAVWSNYSGFSAGSLSLFAGHSSASNNNFHIAHNGGFPALSSTTTVNSRLGLWTHLAVVRSSGQIKLYINGVSEGTPFASTVALDGVGSYFWVGTTGDSPAANPNCYIDDFRVTKGVARYTANFTPPANPHPLK